MRLIWHGTASVEAMCAGGRLLFDPFVPLPGSPTRTTIDEFDGFTDILVSHGHCDHIADLPEIVRRNPAVRVHCTLTPYRSLRRKGVPRDNLSLLSYGQMLALNGFTVRVLHGRHAELPKVGFERLRRMLASPYRGNLPLILREHLRCPENGETVFYQLEAEGKTVSLMGSLNLRGDVDYPTGADLLVLPYNGWEDNYPPAARVIGRLRPKRVVLDHYDDAFPPVTGPVDLAPILDAYPGLVRPMVPGRAEEV